MSFCVRFETVLRIGLYAFKVVRRVPGVISRSFRVAQVSLSGDFGVIVWVIRGFSWSAYGDVLVLP